MSSDRKEPGSGQEQTDTPEVNAPWTQPPDYVPAVDEEDSPSRSGQQQNTAAFSGLVNNNGHYQQQSYQAPEPSNAFDSYDEYNAYVSQQPYQRSSRQQQGFHAPAAPVDPPVDAAEDVPIEPVEPATTPREFLGNLSQYAALIVIPLLLAGLSCLFILPRVAASQAALPPNSFWPLLIVLLAVTIAQGVAVYYAGEDAGLGALSTIGGLALFVLISCLAVYGLVPSALLLIVFLILGVALARRALCPVPDGCVDIVYSGEKYTRTLYPGFNILLPWEKIYTRLSTEEVQWISPVQIVQLSREDDVRLRAIISYQLLQEDAYFAVSRVQNWEQSLQTLFQTTLQEAAATFTPGDFLIWPQTAQQQQQPGEDDFISGFQRRDQINKHVLQLMSERVATWGVQVNWISMRDIELLPHGSAIMPAQTIIPAQQAQPNQARVTPKEQTAPMQISSKIKAVAALVAQTSPVLRASRAPQAAQKAQAPRAAQPQAPKKAQAPQAPHAAATPVATPKAAASANGGAMNESGRINEEVLISAYKAVQTGKITDPETIRRIASEFDAVARDPAASQKVSFDPARAAQNLFEQARKYDEDYLSEVYHEPTQPDWLPRKPGDENLTSGG